MTAFALNFHIIGLTFIALTRVFVPVFYAYKDTWRPLWAAVVSMVVNIAACYLLTPYLDQGGIALANTLSAGAHLVVLMALMGSHIRVGVDAKTLGSILRSLLATAAMAAVAAGKKFRRFERFRTFSDGFSIVFGEVFGRLLEGKIFKHLLFEIILKQYFGTSRNESIKNHKQTARCSSFQIRDVRHGGNRRPGISCSCILENRTPWASRGNNRP